MQRLEVNLLSESEEDYGILQFSQSSPGRRGNSRQAEVRLPLKGHDLDHRDHMTSRRESVKAKMKRKGGRGRARQEVTNSCVTRENWRKKQKLCFWLHPPCSDWLAEPPSSCLCRRRRRRRTSLQSAESDWDCWSLTEPAPPDLQGHKMIRIS